MSPVAAAGSGGSVGSGPCYQCAGWSAVLKNLELIALRQRWVGAVSEETVPWARVTSSVR
jgi:hypothetical protein